MLCYVDDVLIATKTIDQHIERLDEVFGRLKIAGLKCKASKCDFLKTSIKYLGRIVDEKGLRPDPEMKKAIETWQIPISKKQVQSFLGFANYYREFVPHFADIASPLNELVKKKVKDPVQLNESQLKAFESLKLALVSPPVLALPKEEGKFIVDTDASDVAVGVVLSQVQWYEGEWKVRPIGFYSKAMDAAQMRYGTPKQEMLAVIIALNKFRPFLVHQPFTLRSDHMSFGWLKRWSMQK